MSWVTDARNLLERHYRAIKDGFGLPGAHVAVLHLEQDTRAFLDRPLPATGPVVQWPIKCPNGCDGGIEGKLGAEGPIRFRCLKCDNRWLP